MINRSVLWNLTGKGLNYQAVYAKGSSNIDEFRLSIGLRNAGGELIQDFVLFLRDVGRASQLSKGSPLLHVRRSRIVYGPVGEVNLRSRHDDINNLTTPL